MGNIRMQYAAQPAPTTPKYKAPSPTAKVYVSFYELAFEDAHVDMSKPFSDGRRERILTRCASMKSESALPAPTEKYKLKRSLSGHG